MAAAVASNTVKEGVVIGFTFKWLAPRARLGSEEEQISPAGSPRLTNQCACRQPEPIFPTSSPPKLGLASRQALQLPANLRLDRVWLRVGIETSLVFVCHDFKRTVAVAVSFEAVCIQSEEPLRAEDLPLNHMNQLVEVKRFAL